MESINEVLIFSQILKLNIMKNRNRLFMASIIFMTVWNNTDGQNTFPTGAGTNVGIGTTAPATRFQVVGGDSRFGSPVNYSQHASDGDLTFTGAADFLVGGNKYAFRFSGDQDYGLFFNQTNLRYEFRDATAIPVFYTTTAGEGFLAKGLQIGNSALNNAGNIRWTGTDFEGFNGSIWKSFTATGSTTETDPEVGANTTNKIPKWNGTALVAGAINDESSRIGVGDINTNARATFRNRLTSFSSEDIAVHGVDQTYAGSIATTHAAGYLGYNTSGLIFLSGDPTFSHAGVWGNASTTTSSVGVYANNSSTGSSNYGLVAKSLGSGTNNYGIWSTARNGTNNYAGYFDGKVEIKGTDEILTIGGTDPYIQMKEGVNNIGYVRALDDDLLIATNSENETGSLILRANGINSMYINPSGNIVIGNSTVLPKSGYKLSVDGKVVCEELLVQLSPWPDYVFNNDYKLKPLSEVESFIQENNHLPGIPTACDVETEGLNIGEMQKLMMEKIEELTLYLIDIKKENQLLKSEVELLKK
jgi:hypothetical protein